MSNKILLRFASEATNTFTRFFFSSDSVTYNEIIDFLAKKKKIDADSNKKTDQVTLFNLYEQKVA